MNSSPALFLNTLHLSGSIYPSSTLQELQGEVVPVPLFVWALPHSLLALTYAFKLSEVSRL